MRYEKFQEAEFLARPNRFVAVVRTKAGEELKVHVPNTGRCREIFVPHARVLLQRSSNPQRKYPYTLYAAYKGSRLIQVDSAAANKLVAEALQSGRIAQLLGATEVEREKTFASSRFDFRFKRSEKICYMEVKGVTLESHDIALFPDAPTPRGVRHLRELALAVREGYDAYVLFVMQMAGIRYFTPHAERDPAFASALKEASQAGVKILAYDAKVTPGEILLAKEVPVKLEV